MCVRITIFAAEMSRAWLIAVTMRSSGILEFSFSITLLSRLPSGDSLPWVLRGVTGVYCEFSWLAFKQAVGTRTWDPVESSSEFQLISRASGVPLIFFAESEQSSCHVIKSNLVWELYFKILVFCCSGHARRLRSRVWFASWSLCIIGERYFWASDLPYFSWVSFVFHSDCVSRDIYFSYGLVL